ncbi:hypothetical protein [Nocardia brasiliensis]|uniref:hypothetical protein n=1 Tax=Nocardia brasiliensis TaxID=37326 RepID=UPI0024549B6D|nr:hypothetical protein [Nocardia brasiliensis]
MSDRESSTPQHYFDIVAGLDLSLTSTGLAKIANTPGAVPTVGTITSSGGKDATFPQRYARLCGLADAILDELPFDPDTLVILEAPSYGSTTGSQHDRSGLWWMVYDRLRGLGHVVGTVTPTGRAKYATGKGNAGKDAVLAATVRRFPDIAVDSNDIADAVQLMAIGRRLVGKPIDDPMPALNLTALDKVSIPSGVRR